MIPDDAGEEDLMTHAVSLVPRIECHYASRTDPVVLGLNAQGWLFVYFGSDPMYRFDELGRLRRAFVDGKLFRTEGQTLAVMRRDRSPLPEGPASKRQSVLERHDLSAEELADFRERMRHELLKLRQGLCDGQITRQYPADTVGLRDEFLFQVQRILEASVFLAPPIVGR